MEIRKLFGRLPAGRTRILLALSCLVLILIVSIGAIASPRLNKQSLSPAGIIAGIGKAASGVVLGKAAQPTNSHNQPDNKNSSQPKATHQPASSNGHAPSDTVRPGVSTAPVSNSPLAHVIMSPNTMVLGNNYSPRLYMSNGIEISEPASVDSPDISLSWYDDGQGHYASGPYYLGWKPLILRKHDDGGGETNFNLTVRDRAGNRYTTTLKVIWPAPRDLWLDAGGVDKQVQGDNVIYTGHARFRPTGAVGNPAVHMTVGGYDFGYNRDICDSGKTDSRFTYASQIDYNVTCVVSSGMLKNYPGGFDFYANAEITWPLLEPRNYPAKFHAD
jgi:hypothetical protein